MTDKKKDGRRLFREIKKNHHRNPTAEAAAMTQAEAMCHVAAALNEQNDLLRGIEEELQTIAQHTH